MKRTSLLSMPFAALLVLCAATAASGMYHPTLGRWCQRDPAGYADDVSLYAYPAQSVDPYGLLPTDTDREPLDKLKQRVTSGIRQAREMGAAEAADNLERYLAGTGGIRQVSSSWLRGFQPVLDAERDNRLRFEGQIKATCERLQNGQEIEFEDYWDAVVRTRRTKEQAALYYASGTSTLRSRGKFIIGKSGVCCYYAGPVEHHWYDYYNWDEGKMAVLPNGDVIRDSDMQRFQDEGNAKPFFMESYWDQMVLGASEPGRGGGPAVYDFQWTPVGDGKSRETFKEPPFGQRMEPHLKALGLNRHGERI